MASITADTTLSGALRDTPVRLTGCGDRLGPRCREAGRTRPRPRCALGARVEYGGDVRQGCRGRCMDRAALARAPGRRSDVGLAGVASRSGRALGLEASGLGGMVGCDRQQRGDHLLHSAPGFCNGGKSCHSHLPATKMCVETMPKNPALTGKNPWIRTPINTRSGKKRCPPGKRTLPHGAILDT